MKRILDLRHPYQKQFQSFPVETYTEKVFVLPVSSKQLVSIFLKRFFFLRFKQRLFKMIACIDDCLCHSITLTCSILSQSHPYIPYTCIPLHPYLFPHLFPPPRVSVIVTIRGKNTLSIPFNKTVFTNAPLKFCITEDKTINPLFYQSIKEVFNCEKLKECPNLIFFFKHWSGWSALYHCLIFDFVFLKVVHCRIRDCSSPRCLKRQQAREKRSS